MRSESVCETTINKEKNTNPPIIQIIFFTRNKKCLDGGSYINWKKWSKIKILLTYLASKLVILTEKFYSTMKKESSKEAQLMHQ